METTTHYSNFEHPLFPAIMGCVLFTASAVAFTLSAMVSHAVLCVPNSLLSALMLTVALALLFLSVLCFWHSAYYTLDTSKQTITVCSTRTRPLDIADIDRIKFFVLKGGRQVCIIIYEKKGRHTIVFLNKKKAISMAHELKRVNPSIKLSSTAKDKKLIIPVAAPFLM